MNSNKLIEKRKKTIFYSMSEKRRIKILKKTSYKNWNPFEEPKKPIDIRTNSNGETLHSILSNFISYEKKNNKKISKNSIKELSRMVIGLINKEEVYETLYRFSLWYFYKKKPSD